MATIKTIEARSVHQIQSGQVIVDVCSVVKELVENGLDAGANSIEIRFKNYGLDSIEVQDNGSGISPANYESVAQKHHTSKLSVYDDLSSLDTFGFRGEALSSLCALSTFYMTTAQVDEAPKGKRLDFAVSGKLKSTTVVACQKGTTATVENLFETLPVRRKELSKNIKREYSKVIGLLHAYACVSTGVRFSVKNAASKGKSMVVFATNANSRTRENIANVYGAKTLQALVALDLELDLQPMLTQMSRDDTHTTRIMVSGHISRPVWGEGRQTPDRQMFFVNGRPCGLPQIAKAMNEVYKSFNVSQSPFILADFQMDTNAYDVNVSPDKRTILLHNATGLVEKLKESLNALFEKQDQTVPQSQIRTANLPAFKQLSIQRTGSGKSTRSHVADIDKDIINDGTSQPQVSDEDQIEEEINTRNMLHDHFRAQASTRDESQTMEAESSVSKVPKVKERQAAKVAKAIAAREHSGSGVDQYDDVRDLRDLEDDESSESDGGDENNDEVFLRKEMDNIKVRDFNRRMAEQQEPIKTHEDSASEKSPIPVEDDQRKSVDHKIDRENQANVVQNAFDRIRPQRPAAEIAVISVGDHITTKIVGNGLPSQLPAGSSPRQVANSKKQNTQTASTLQFSQKLRKFGAPGTQYGGSELMVGESDNQISSSDEEASVCSDNGSVAIPAGESTRKARNKTGNEDLDGSDTDYVDEAGEKAEEEARVAELIHLAEESVTRPSKESLRRANRALRAAPAKDSTANLVTHLELEVQGLETSSAILRKIASEAQEREAKIERAEELAAISDEEKLSLTVTRSDFAKMDVIGQFNLGFVLAVRKISRDDDEADNQSTSPICDELFIVDQHASDEKYNFERLQATTTVSNQRLVYPIILDLTAVEEEIVLENLPALEKNGFIVETDTSGSSPIGQRCRLLTLPLSKEVTFDTRDLDELIHLLAESPTFNDESKVPRPVKVRKMFAMRACRSSIMIGKTLSKRQMSDVLRHMGEIDKPWNCPHGRPTMRHLTSLQILGGWREGKGFTGDSDQGSNSVWAKYSRISVALPDSPSSLQDKIFLDASGALRNTTESTEAPTSLDLSLPPVQLKYVALPTPLPSLDGQMSLTASGNMRPPCRRCLLDAQPGEMLKLIAYDPFPADSVTPYRGNGPIFVHAHDCALFDGDMLPERQLRRQLSLRAYDENHMMCAAETVEGDELEKVAGGMLADGKARYINVHNAKPGCFAVRIERA